MRIFAYCTERAREAVAAATGVEPLTSPPTTATPFDPQWMEGYDLLYFRLHSLDNAIGWYGEAENGALTLALTKVQVEVANLENAIVVVGNCFGSIDPMTFSFYRAGAKAVIAGPGSNLAAGARVIGTDLLVKWLIRGLGLSMKVEQALRFARARLLATAWRYPDRDALQFRIL